MPTRWETFPVEFKGGLVTNLSRLQQGAKQPGSARELVNFEPSIKGGYRRINGFIKYDDDFVPSFGGAKVQGSGQSGTTLVVGNVLEAPVSGVDVTISGVTGTYEVSSVSYSSSNKEATLTLATSLATSPSDKAEVTFSNRASPVEGLFFSKVGSGRVYAIRDGQLHQSEGSGWTRISVPSYGTLKVDGGSQTGTSLDIDGISSDTYGLQAGDTFTISGVEKVYSVVSATGPSSGASTLTIAPSLASSPADNADITVLSSDLGGAEAARFAEFNFDGTLKLAVADGSNYPCVYDGTNFKRLISTTDIQGASYVAAHNDHLFFAKEDLLVFSAPFNEDDYSVANGAGSVRLPGTITGLISFRQNLIVFTDKSISSLSGSSVSDFQLNHITLDIGCLQGDTIQEVGGDILFLGPDGLRFLGATDRIGDFSLALASRTIQDEILSLIRAGTPLTSTVIRGKNQYRLFDFVSGRVTARSIGYIGVQFVDQDYQGFAWSRTEGIKAYRVSSNIVGSGETVVFSHEDGFVYQLDVGNTFDGYDIAARFYTPYLSVGDPLIRKTLYSVSTYYDPEGTFTGTMTPNYDFNDPDKIQPLSSELSAGGSFSYYGEAVYGVSLYGGKPETVVKQLVTGSCTTVSLQYEFIGNFDPFILDTVLIEFKYNDRK